MGNPLKFQFSSLKVAGNLHFAGSVPAEEFQASVTGAGVLCTPLDIELDVDLHGGRVELTGNVKGEWTLECCRCLERPSLVYDALLEGTQPAVEGGTIDATDDVRQALVLALPLRACCKPDCKGLCAQCGANKNFKDCGCVPPPQGVRLRRGSNSRGEA